MKNKSENHACLLTFRKHTWDDVFPINKDVAVSVWTLLLVISPQSMKQIMDYVHNSVMSIENGDGLSSALTSHVNIWNACIKTCTHISYMYRYNPSSTVFGEIFEQEFFV